PTCSFEAFTIYDSVGRPGAPSTVTLPTKKTGVPANESRTLPPDEGSHSARRSAKRPVANRTRRLCRSCCRLSDSPSCAAINPRRIFWSASLIPGNSTFSIFALKHAELGGAERSRVWARDWANRLPAIANTTNARMKLPLVNHAPGQKFETFFWP